MIKQWMVTSKKWALTAKHYASKNRKRVLATSIGLACVLAAGVLVALVKEARPSKPIERPAVKKGALKEKVKSFEQKLSRSSRSGGSSSQSAGLRYNFRAGDLLDFDFEWTSELTMDMPASSEAASAPAGMPPMAFHLMGAVTLAVYEADSRFAIGWRFKGASANLEMPGQVVPPEPQSELSSEVNQEVLVDMQPSGGVEEMYFTKGASAMAMNLLKGLILQMQMSLPAAPGDRWEAVESDTTGRYAAEYSAEAGYRSGETEFFKIMRRKTKYESLFSSASLTSVPSIQGDTTGYFNGRGGCFHILRASEELRLDARETAQGFHGRLEAQLEFQSRSRNESLAMDGASLAAKIRKGAARSGVGVMEGAEEALAAFENAALERLAGGRSAREVANELEDLLKHEKPDSPKLSDFWNALVAILKLSEGALAQAAELIRDTALSVGVRRQVASALSEVGTPAAQQALVALLQDSLEPEVKGSILFGLAQSRSPSPESEKALRDVAAGPAEDRLTATALLGLGMMGRHIASSDPARAKEFAQYFKESMGRFGTSNWQAQCLTAIGNAGLKQNVQEVQPYLQNEDPHVRATATYALRHMNTPKADEILGGVMANDADNQVRLMAARAIEVRTTPEARKLMETTLDNPQTDPSLRRIALFYLGRQSDEDARTRIAAIASNESSQDLRDMAREILESER